MTKFAFLFPADGVNIVNFGIVNFGIVDVVIVNIVNFARRLMIVVTALALFSAVPILAQTSAAARPARPLVIGQTHRLASPTLGQPREINVWLPPSYAEGTRAYPVLYVIDGGAAQDFHHISGLAQLATISETFEEMIVVGIATDVRSRELTAPATDPRFKTPYFTTGPRPSGGAATFRRHVTGEVVPFIGRAYRTNGRRALIGESLAGLFVLETFFRSPAAFTDYIAVSPSLWWDGKALSRDAPALLARHDDVARRLYLTMADEGGTMQAGMDAVVAALKAGAPERLAWSYVDRRRTDTHATIYHGAALDALRTLFAVPPYPTGPEEWYMREGGVPPVLK